MDVSSATSTAVQPASSGALSKLTNDFDNFLRLLTTQLQNQDPLEPLDSNEFTAQLVSFTGVEQQINTNKKLEQLVSLQSSSNTTLGLSFLGLAVEREGETFLHDGQSPVELSYTLPESAVRSRVAILDENNNVVYSFDGEITQGKHKFIWSGESNDGLPLQPGTYRLQVGAIDSDNRSLDVTQTVPGIVTGIETADTGEILLVIGEDKIPVSEVTAARIPGT